ncbi:MAG TPA: hypothetical protein VMG31_16975 [Verrucomicrobiae bacterium]|nr:hypothetical protein [Verrucomicrobiae bacterium]
MTRDSPATLPLPTLLSQALVAFIIEFDNEFEHQAPHRTTRFGATLGWRRPPFLVSMVMWAKLFRFIPEEGITIGELLRVSGIPVADLRPLLIRVSRWWSYVTVEAVAEKSERSEPSKAQVKTRSTRASKAGWLIRPTPGGRKALEVWQPLTAVIERRWDERFGKSRIDSLRKSLGVLTGRLDAALPSFLPILGYGLCTRRSDPAPRSPAAGNSTFDNSLPALLSKTLLAFALEFETESEVSLAICANVLRLTGEDGASVRDLPRRAGISKEAVAMALSFLSKRGFAAVRSLSRTKHLVLTAKGQTARNAYFRLVHENEEGWRQRCGEDAIGALREPLEYLIGDGTANASPLSRGLEPYPDCWRAAVANLETLPHFPMILHRGGYPDGS